jgi:uncharacterized protein
LDPLEAGSERMSETGFSLYEASIPAFQGGLRTLSGLLDKAEAFVADGKLTEADLVESSLAKDMDPFRRQIQNASDTAKAAAMRLAGRSVPSIEDTETTFAELRERIRRTEEILESVGPADLVGSEDRTIKVNLRRQWTTFDGRAYLVEFALPNFFFHVTTAYAILRHNGVAIGKLDYLSDVTRRRTRGPDAAPVAQ